MDVFTSSTFPFPSRRRSLDSTRPGSPEPLRTHPPTLPIPPHPVPFLSSDPSPSSTRLRLVPSPIVRTPLPRHRPLSCARARPPRLELLGLEPQLRPASASSASCSARSAARISGASALAQLVPERRGLVPILARLRGELPAPRERAQPTALLLRRLEPLGPNARHRAHAPAVCRRAGVAKREPRVEDVAEGRRRRLPPPPQNPRCRPAPAPPRAGRVPASVAWRAPCATPWRGPRC